MKFFLILICLIFIGCSTDKFNSEGCYTNLRESIIFTVNEKLEYGIVMNIYIYGDKNYNYSHLKYYLYEELNSFQPIDCKPFKLKKDK